MDTEEEASDYDAMDHGEVNRRFVADLVAFHPPSGQAPVLDVGTGTALIPIELCRLLPAVRVVAIDMADSMLTLARRNVVRAGLTDRIDARKIDGKATGLEAGGFQVVMSNSIVHHIASPGAVLGGWLDLVSPGGALFVRDLLRPATDDAVAQLVATYATVDGAASPKVQAMQTRQRDLFEASLRAALTVEEMRALLAPHGVPAAAVQPSSDRHFTVAYRRPT